MWSSVTTERLTPGDGISQNEVMILCWIQEGTIITSSRDRSQWLIRPPGDSDVVSRIRESRAGGMFIHWYCCDWVFFMYFIFSKTGETDVLSHLLEVFKTQGGGGGGGVGYTYCIKVSHLTQTITSICTSMSMSTGISLSPEDHIRIMVGSQKATCNSQTVSM